VCRLLSLDSLVIMHCWFRPRSAQTWRSTDILYWCRSRDPMKRY